MRIVVAAVVLAVAVTISATPASAATWSWPRGTAARFGQVYNYRGRVLECKRPEPNGIVCHSSLNEVWFATVRVSRCRMRVTILLGKAYLKRLGLVTGASRIPAFVRVRGCS